jgi:hypothetical protein
MNTARFALEAVLVYELALLYSHEHEMSSNAGLKRSSEPPREIRPALK